MAHAMNGDQRGLKNKVLSAFIRVYPRPEMPSSPSF
jgi:hypothetical protein